MKNTFKLEPACFVIKSFEEVGRAIAYMHRHHADALSDGRPLVVRMDQKQEDRSKAQNRLYWLWLSQWSKRQGTDKDTEHLFFKKQFLARIYDRDEVGQYKQTFAAVKVLKDQKHPQYQAVADGLNELISTTDATVDQFTEYLNDIHAFCNKQGCWLSTPDDLMWCYQD
ncbi:MAG TPA: hypothetical protein PLT61_10110 [Acinetobacter johnsonii]|nr:hypothetical protein [Acinetobacter johnsonii]